MKVINIHDCSVLTCNTMKTMCNKSTTAPHNNMQSCTQAQKHRYGWWTNVYSYHYNTFLLLVKWFEPLQWWAPSIVPYALVSYQYNTIPQLMQENICRYHSKPAVLQFVITRPSWTLDSLNQATQMPKTKGYLLHNENGWPPIKHRSSFQIAFNAVLASNT